VAGTRGCPHPKESSTVRPPAFRRPAARGEALATVSRIAGAAAPSGSVTTLAVRGTTVTVTVTAPVHPLGPVPLRVRVLATSTGELEPGAQP
jgi:hypothetical protein